MEALDLQKIAAALCALLPRYDVEEAYLFGSYARGEADADSDVDICIECGSTFTLFSLGGLSLDLERALGTSVDVVCGADSLYPRAKRRYLQDRKLLYEKS